MTNQSWSVGAVRVVPIRGKSGGKRLRIDDSRVDHCWHRSCSRLCPAAPKALFGTTKMGEKSDTLNHADDDLHQSQGGNSARFKFGIALIVTSFSVYLAYPVILLLVKTSGQIKVIATVLVWAMSWAVFSIGVFLTGPEGYLRLKAFWSRFKPALRADN